MARDWRAIGNCGTPARTAAGRAASLLLLSFVACAAMAGTASRVHKVPTSASWFPADAESLGKLLDQTFQVAAKRGSSAPPRPGLRGLIVPHAALAYSGTIAAAAFRCLDRPRNVVILALSHSRPIEGIQAPDLDAYATPLGEVRVNREALRELGYPIVPEERLCDHSLENQLPLLQRASPGTAVVPLYVGQLDDQSLQAAAKKLSRRVEQGDVIVASSDFTHYGAAYGYTPFPNDKDLPARLFQRAMTAFEQIGSLETAELDRFLARTGDTICGRGPIRLLMSALARLREDSYLHALDFVTSGDLTRDWKTSVSYGALAFYRASAFSVSGSDQDRLLASARRTLDRYLKSGKKERVPVPPPDRTPATEQRTGVFVSIKKNGRLRGCVGTLLPPTPLWDAVADRTLAAAAEDPRYKPLTAAEGPVALEISLLTPLKKLSSWRRYRLGLGAVIALDGKTGLLLPQVAAENNWTREQFLENLARKAGLEPKAYTNPRATVYVYSAQVFSENVLPLPSAGGGPQ